METEIQTMDATPGSDEWNEFRKSGVSASNAAAVCRVGYVSVYEYYREVAEDKKKKISPFLQAKFDYGNENEAAALELIPEATPNKIFHYRTIDGVLLGATADALGRGSVVEAKCPENIDELKPERILQYLIQLVVQMIVHRDAERGYLVIYGGPTKDSYILEFPRDTTWFRSLSQIILSECRTFLEHVRTKTCPPRLASGQKPRVEIWWAEFVDPVRGTNILREFGPMVE